MNRAWAFILSVLVFFLWLGVSQISYGKGIEYGRDAEGRRTETDDNGAWGKTVTTYDSETGFEVYRQWFDPDGTLLKETFTNLPTGEVRQVSYYDFATQKAGRWETTEIDQRVLDAMRRREEALERLKEKPPQDEWDFLPDFIPGVSVYENMDKPSQDSAPAPKPESKPEAKQAPQGTPADAGQSERRGHGWFGGKGDGTGFPWERAGDSKPPATLGPSPKNDSSQDKEPMPITDPEPLAPEPEPNPQPDFDSAPDFSGFGSLGSVNEPEPEEIDYSKYGDQQVYDPNRGLISIVNSQTKTVTTIYPREGGWFGNSTWTTHAVTTLDGKTIHEDYYAHNGKLVQSTEVNPSSGVRTSTIFNPDGSIRMEQTDANGKPIENKVSTTDPKTGQTTTSVGNPDGTHTVTVTDKDGNVISQETTKDGIVVSQETTGKKDPNVMIEGSATDPKTGITKTGKKLKDGTTEIIITDQDGKVIGTEIRDASGKLMSQAPEADRFSQFDAMNRSPFGQLAVDSTPTAVLDGAQGRDLAFGAGVIGGSTQSESSPEAEYEDS